MSARGRKRIHVTEWRPETNEWYEHAIPTERSSKGGAVVLAVILGSVSQKHRTTDPACTLYVEPRTWIQRMRFERGRGRSCPICSNYFSDMEILTNDYCSTLARAVAAEELAALQGGRAGVAESERDALRSALADIHRWAEAIADHFGDEWPHTPACLGEAGCPLCMISEAASDPGEWLATRVVEVKAEALREAADDYGINLTVATGPQIRAWLRARADRIEREARS